MIRSDITPFFRQLFHEYRSVRMKVIMFLVLGRITRYSFRVKSRGYVSESRAGIAVGLGPGGRFRRRNSDNLVDTTSQFYTSHRADT